MNRKTKIKILGLFCALGLLMVGTYMLVGCVGRSEDNIFYVLNDGLSLEITGFNGNLTLSILGDSNEITILETVGLDSVEISGSDNIVYVSSSHRNFTRDIKEGLNSKIVVYD